MSPTHLMVETLDDITNALKDTRATVAVSAINFSKAFNRLDQLECLEFIQRKGPPKKIMDLLGSFLTDRRIEG